MSKYDKARRHQINKLVNTTISKMGNYSDRATTALMMIIAHESLKGTLREQVISFDAEIDWNYKRQYSPYNYHNDYARGITGIEGFTHDDLWIESDNINKDYLNVFGVTIAPTLAKINRCIHDDMYSIFMARKKLHMITEQIPRELSDIAAYLVKYYNAGGKAVRSDYLNAYVDW